MVLPAVFPMLVARSTQLLVFVLVSFAKMNVFTATSSTCIRLQIKSMPKVNDGHVEIKTTYFLNCLKSVITLNSSS